MRILLPWSKIHIPGVTAVEITDGTQCIDPIVDVPHSAAAELTAAFAAVALIAAGLCALLKGDTFVMAALLVVLLLVVLVVAPQVPTLMVQLQHAIDARIPVALR